MSVEAECTHATFWGSSHIFWDVQRSENPSATIETGWDSCFPPVHRICQRLDSKHKKPADYDEMNDKTVLGDWKENVRLLPGSRWVMDSAVLFGLTQRMVWQSAFPLEEKCIISRHKFTSACHLIERAFIVWQVRMKPLNGISCWVTCRCVIFYMPYNEEQNTSPYQTPADKMMSALNALYLIFTSCLMMWRPIKVILQVLLH